jgi:thiol-disulfide isomerase/thioredoxin
MHNIMNILRQTVSHTRKQLLTACLGTTLSLLPGLAPAHALNISPYNPGDWQSLVNSRNQQAMIVHFWGFTCAPCLEELPRWGKFVGQHPEVNTVFIEVDQIPEAIAEQALTHAQLAQAVHRSSTAYFDEYMRYEIDPKWMGELPLTLLISANGEVRRLRGTVDFTVLGKWLKSQH